MQKFLSALALMLGAGQPLVAAAESVWTDFPVYDFANGERTESKISGTEAASKKWHLCAVLPHMKDGYFVSVNYGLVSEAQRLGVRLTILQAGDYSQLARQVSQYDDCVSSGADAVLIAPISEAGLSDRMTQNAAKGLVQIGLVNPITEAPVTSKIFVDYATKGRQTGSYLVQLLGKEGGGAVALPGPQGSGWAESYMSGFREGVSGSKLLILEEKYGPAGVAESLSLVEDALQIYPDLKAIWGGAPAAEAAVGAVEEAGAEDVVIVASYENQTMVDHVKSGKITAFATEYPVMQGRIAVSLAVAALDGNSVPSYLGVIPQMVTPENVDAIDLTTILAPQGFSPVFSVD